MEKAIELASQPGNQPIIIFSMAIIVMLAIVGLGFLLSRLGLICRKIKPFFIHFFRYGPVYIILIFLYVMMIWLIPIDVCSQHKKDWYWGPIVSHGILFFLMWCVLTVHDLLNTIDGEDNNSEIV